VGPTGVGKTELARTAWRRYLFGAEERMVRFDMSEYTDVEAAERLIRGTDGAEGLLTRRVREQPFCVLLLDEIEKAHASASSTCCSRSAARGGSPTPGGGPRIFTTPSSS
jgi:ATP-dependent Clp protease ATP-binding subunit ClpA